MNTDNVEGVNVTLANGDKFTVQISETFEESEIFICECNSIEHQAKFYYWKGKNYDTFNILIHLTTYKNIFKRIWYAIKYIVGYKSRFGAWDEMLLKKDDCLKLYEFLKNYLEIK